jgi:hypothetical protein
MMLPTCVYRKGGRLRHLLLLLLWGLQAAAAWQLQACALLCLKRLLQQ